MMRDADATLVLRALGAADLAAAQALTAGASWPHRVEDWRFMLDLGEGIAAAQDGTLVGTLMTWRYGAAHAALGAVCVAPEMQRRGIGRRLMEAALDRLAGRTVLLHATEAGLPLYRSLGFVEAGMVRQYQGAAFNPGLVALGEGERLRPIGRSDPAALQALDRAACGMDRTALIRALIEAGAGVVLDRDGAAAGFALLRRFGRGQVIGPVAAPDLTGARAMISHLLGTQEGRFVRIDVPEESGLVPWLEELGLGDAGPAIRMLRAAPGGALPGALPGVLPAMRGFALASQAFG